METDNSQKLEDEIVGLLERLRKVPPYLVDGIADKARMSLIKLEAEIDNQPLQKKAGLQTRIRQYRHEIERARSQVEAGGLHHAILVAHETEQVGAEVGQTLRGQRDQLLRTRDRLTETNIELSRASRLIQAIRIRLITNKMFLIVIIILECAIILALCYAKFFRH